jgi:hypothetical protein
MTLDVVAQMAKDKFYQDYAPDDAFFDMDHFKLDVMAFYSTMLADEFRRLKREARMETGFSFLEIDGSFLVHKKAKVERVDGHLQVTLPTKPFSFAFDSMSTGVQGVDLVGTNEQMIRIAYAERHIVSRSATNNKIYYFVRSDKTNTNLIFLGTRDISGHEVEVGYIPSISLENGACEGEIGDDMVMPVITQVLNLAFGAKNGQIIDKSNDSNPNTIAQGEVNPNSLKTK